jgi:hypothetical protein
MRLQIWIVGAAFAIFGVIAWIVTGFFSVAYIGLILFGAVAIILGYFSGK